MSSEGQLLFSFFNNSFRYVLGGIDHENLFFFSVSNSILIVNFFMQIIAEEFFYGFWRELFFNSIFTHIKKAHVSARRFVDTRMDLLWNCVFGMCRV